MKKNSDILHFLKKTAKSLRILIFTNQVKKDVANAMVLVIQVVSEFMKSYGLTEKLKK